MKNLNLSYTLFGIFLLIVVTVITCGDKGKTEIHVMPEEVLSFPNPEEVKEEVKAKVEEVEQIIEEKAEEIKEEVEQLKEMLPSLPVIPTIEKAEEILIEETPADSTKTSKPENKTKGDE
tara:strand:- start:137 stop:496 length:360 start_codon:yes stop_codon:yes gene_type:complete